MLNPDDIADLQLAGSIAAEVLQKTIENIEPGVKILKICKLSEDLIQKLDPNARPAFPLNLSFNSVAAHDTAAPNDPRKVPKDCLVKADIGVHINGWIADTAATKALGKGKKAKKLIDAAEIALNAAIDEVKPGVRVSKIGEIIEDSISENGLKSVKNLTGHTIGRYSLHAGISIPNYRHSSLKPSPKLQKGMILAIEPFTTPGKGFVTSNSPPKPLIFSLQKTRLDNRLGPIEESYGNLPFALRWLSEKTIPITFKELMDLAKKRQINFYSPLKEQSNSLVAQAEHTMFITENGAEITTRM